MFHNLAIRAYCQQAGKALDLPRKHKRRLLDGLERELEEQFSDKTGTLEDLCKVAGPPEESAAELMECVNGREQAQYQIHRRLLLKNIIISLAIFMVLLAAYFIYLTQYDVDHTEVRIVQSNVEQYIKRSEKFKYEHKKESYIIFLAVFTFANTFYTPTFAANISESKSGRLEAEHPLRASQNRPPLFAIKAHCSLFPIQIHV